MTDTRSTVAADDMRDAFSRWASGVAIVTALDHLQQPQGMTINSLISLSLEPALLLWTVGQHAPEFEVFCDTEYFTVHMLAQGQQVLSNRFADSGADKFAGLSWQAGAAGCPLLADCLVRLQCRVHERHAAADHHILIGEVSSVEPLNANADALLYYAGGYRTVGSAPTE